MISKARSLGNSAGLKLFEAVGSLCDNSTCVHSSVGKYVVRL